MLPGERSQTGEMGKVIEKSSFSIKWERQGSAKIEGKEIEKTF